MQGRAVLTVVPAVQGMNEPPEMRGIAEVDWFRQACGEYIPSLTLLSDNATSLVEKTLTPRGKHFMSGLAGIVVAALMCNSGLDIYGFDTGREPAATFYHYYDPDASPRMDLDDPSESRRMLLRLAARERQQLEATHELAMHARGRKFAWRLGRARCFIPSSKGFKRSS